MNLTVTDKKNETSNNFSVNVGTTTENFCHCFRENLKLLAGAYDALSVVRTLSFKATVSNTLLH